MLRDRRAYIETGCWIYNSVKNIIPDDRDTRRAEIISVEKQSRVRLSQT